MIYMFNTIHFCLLMYLKILEISVLKYINLIVPKVELELLTDIDIRLMVEKGTRGGICQAIHYYVKANNKYMKHDKNISSYLMYLDANNLYGWAVSQKLPVNAFKWVEKLSRFNDIFIKITMKIVISDIFLK